MVRDHAHDAARSVFENGRTKIINNINMSGSVDDQFDAAVKIVQGLPKNGAYQPSNALRLKFYSLFKQATVGKCNSSKPGFWDVINRAKWESWFALGDLPSIDAKRQYIDNMKEIIETMSYDEKVEDFVTKLGPIKENGLPESGLDENMAKMQELVAQLPDANHTNKGKVPSLDHNSNMNVPQPISNGHAQQDTVSNTHYDVHVPSKPMTVPVRDDNGQSPMQVDNEPDIERHNQSQSRHSSFEHVTGHSEEEVFADATDKLESMPVVNGQTTHKRHEHNNIHKRRKKKQSSPELNANDVSLVAYPARAQSTFLNSPILPIGSALTPLDQKQSFEELERLFEASWEAVERLHVHRLIRQSNQDNLRHASGASHHNQMNTNNTNTSNGHGSIRKVRGRGEDSGQSPNADNKSTGTGSGSAHSSHNSSTQQEAPNQTHANGNGHAHGSSRSATSCSTSSTDSDMLVDTHVSHVLMRMNRQLSQIGRQLNLIEDSLIAQHRLTAHLIQQYTREQLGGGVFPSNWSWRTIGFVLCWPVLVHLLIKLYPLLSLRIRRRRM